MKNKPTNSEKIIAALSAIDKSVRNLRKFADRYDTHIDNAALRGDDARAKQLIKQKIGVNSLAEQLITLKDNIALGAYTAQAAADLAKLPDAIAGCKGLLSESPNFGKIGKDIEKVFKDMQKPAEEIAKLNNILDGVLSPKPEDSFTSRLDDTPEDEKTDAFQAEWAAMMERLKIKAAGEAVTKPAENTDLATGDVDISGIMSDEIKKKGE